MRVNRIGRRAPCHLVNAMRLPVEGSSRLLNHASAPMAEAVRENEVEKYAQYARYDHRILQEANRWHA